jgi:drug/metabolite transporter (DMT)-like permease
MVATLVWGASFIVTRQAVQGVAPLAFVAGRFAVAALMVGVVTRPDMRGLTRTELRAGAALGAAMFGGYGLQAIGMHLGVTSGRAAFISALYVPIVPLLQMVLLRRQPPAATWLALALACAGLMLMAGPLGAGQAGLAEFLVLVGAFSIAAEILLIGAFARVVDARRLAVVECAILACLCVGGMAATGQAWPAWRIDWMAASLALGVGSAGLQIALNWAQRFVPPAKATLIYTMEPVWAGIFGMMAGERMGVAAVVGAGLILGSLVVSGRGKEAVPF